MKFIDEKNDGKIVISNFIKIIKFSFIQNKQISLLLDKTLSNCFEGKKIMTKLNFFQKIKKSTAL